MTDAARLHEHVREALVADGCHYAVHDHWEFPVKITSPAEFAAALGYEIDRITKTLFLRSREEQRYAAAVCSVGQRLDFELAAAAAGVKRLEVASPEELRERVGYPRNGVSPLGLAAALPVVVDAKLLDCQTVLVGGGALAVEVELAPADLVRIARATVACITAA